MFTKLEKKIRIVILFTLILCISIAGILSFTTVKNSIFRNFTGLCLQYTALQNENVKMYLKFIEETSRLITDNSNVISALSSSTFDGSIIPILDGVRSSNLTIIGVSIYSTDGSVYTSSGISNAPSLIQLQESKFFTDFIISNTVSQWKVRYDEIYPFYNSTYNKNAGILTLFEKIKDTDGTVVGYLLLDTDMNSFYNLYNTGNKKPFQDYSLYLFTNENEFLHAPFSAPLDNKMINEINKAIHSSKPYAISQNKKYLIISNQVSNCNAMSFIVIPLSGVYISMVGYTTVLIISCLGFLVLSYFFALVLSKSISIPLNRLYYKMQNPIN